jgi:ribonuclease HII
MNEQAGTAAKKWIIGVDEAGRGPVAGPVSVGVVAVEEGFDLLAAFPGLNDSKQLSEKKREAIFESLVGFCDPEFGGGQIRFVVNLSSAAMIDAEGIVPAVRSALYKGVREMLPNPAGGKVFLDGALRTPSEYEQETVIGGDGIVPAIMLASVAAKVVRDRLMVQLAEKHPGYGFEKHKGYGTKTHYAAITEKGMSNEHRKTFLKKF